MAAAGQAEVNSPKEDVIQVISRPTLEQVQEILAGIYKNVLGGDGNQLLGEDGNAVTTVAKVTPPPVDGKELPAYNQEFTVLSLRGIVNFFMDFYTHPKVGVFVPGFPALDPVFSDMFRGHIVEAIDLMTHLNAHELARTRNPQTIVSSIYLRLAGFFLPAEPQDGQVLPFTLLPAIISGSLVQLIFSLSQGKSGRASLLESVVLRKQIGADTTHYLLELTMMGFEILMKSGVWPRNILEEIAKAGAIKESMFSAKQPQPASSGPRMDVGVQDKADKGEN